MHHYLPLVLFYFMHSLTPLHSMEFKITEETNTSKYSSSDDMMEIVTEGNSSQHTLIPEGSYQQFGIQIQQKEFFNAIRSHDYQQFIQLLKTNPGLAHAYSPQEHETALTLATLHGHIDFVTTLLEHGANPNIPKIRGWTALIVAALNNQLALAELLVQHGANVLTEHQFSPVIEPDFNDWKDLPKNRNFDALEMQSHYKLSEGDSLPKTTAIEHAISNGHYAITIFLLNEYKKISQTSPALAKRITIHTACLKSCITITLKDAIEKLHVAENELSNALCSTLPEVVLNMFNHATSIALKHVKILKKINLAIQQFSQELAESNYSLRNAL
jgi:hypothetical protein